MLFLSSNSLDGGSTHAVAASLPLPLSPHLLERIDEPVGGGIVPDHGRIAGQFGEDRLGELFAELDSPLIEGVDVPDDPLDEDFVLVEGDEGAEGGGGELREEDGVGRA